MRALPLISDVADENNRDASYTLDVIKERTWGNGRGLHLFASSLGPEAGLGVFTVAPIAAGSVVTEFQGAKVSYAISKELTTHLVESHARTLVSQRWLILPNWALSEGSNVPTHIANPVFELPYRYGLGGYLNDNFRNKKNNTEYRQIRERGYDLTEGVGVAVFVVATQDISAGSELFASYGDDYWARVTK